MAATKQRAPKRPRRVEASTELLKALATVHTRNSDASTPQSANSLRMLRTSSQTTAISCPGGNVRRTESSSARKEWKLSRPVCTSRRFAYAMMWRRRSLSTLSGSSAPHARQRAAGQPAAAGARVSRSFLCTQYQYRAWLIREKTKATSTRKARESAIVRRKRSPKKQLHSVFTLAHAAAQDETEPLPSNTSVL